MSLPSATISLLARAVAEEFTADEIRAKRKKLLSGEGKRVASWSDVGLSVSHQYDFSFADAVAVYIRALDIVSGKPARSASGIYYAN